MPATTPTLEPGRVYRTAYFESYTPNASRFARKLVNEGRLRRVARGMYYAPQTFWFGEAAPSTEALLDAYLNGTPWLETGPDRWNALGLGTTALFADSLVYNTLRTDDVKLGGRTFMLRRREFPATPPAEWFVVDLLDGNVVGVETSEVERNLVHAIRVGKFDSATLADMASKFGDASLRARVRQCLAMAADVPA